jgi:hypothetical protein
MIGRDHGAFDIEQLEVALDGDADSDDGPQQGDETARHFRDDAPAVVGPP